MRPRPTLTQTPRALPTSTTQARTRTPKSLPTHTAQPPTQTPKVIPTYTTQPATRTRPPTALPPSDQKGQTEPTVTLTYTLAPVSEPVTPTLIEPYPGLTYKSPVTFRWLGTLNEGELFQVTIRHLGSGQEIQTNPMAEQEWTYDLPAGKVGEWQWKVWVVKEGRVLVTSEERSFWFDPWMDHEKPGKAITPTLPWTVTNPAPTSTSTITSTN